MERLSPRARNSAKKIFVNALITKEYQLLSRKDAVLLRDFIYATLQHLHADKPIASFSHDLPSMKHLQRETLLRMIQRRFAKVLVVLPSPKKRCHQTAATANGFTFTGLTISDLKNGSRDSRRQRFAEVCGILHPWMREYCARVISNMPLQRLIVILKTCKVGPDVSLGMLIMCVPNAHTILDKWCSHLIPASKKITRLHKAAHTGWKDGSGRRLAESYVASVGAAMLQAHADRHSAHGMILLGPTTRQYIYQMMDKYPAGDYARRCRGLTDDDMELGIEEMLAAPRACDVDDPLLTVTQRIIPISIVRPDTGVTAAEAKYVSQLCGYTRRADVAMVMSAYYAAEPFVRRGWVSWAEDQWRISSPILPGERLLAHHNQRQPTPPTPPSSPPPPPSSPPPPPTPPLVDVDLILGDFDADGVILDSLDWDNLFFDAENM
jgi:hypothetical protein